MARAKRVIALEKGPLFDVEAFLASTKNAQTMRYRRRAVIYSQGDESRDIKYIQSGAVKLTTTSSSGREAVIAILEPGDFFGEGPLAGQPRRMGTAVAHTATTVLTIHKDAMTRLLHEEPAFAERFLAHMLQRNAKIEADLVDQLFNSSEKRLARALLLMARFGHTDAPMPKISQETLAAMIGSTRSRVNFFMNKFRTLGLIEYNGHLKVHPALMSVILHD